MYKISFFIKYSVVFLLILFAPICGKCADRLFPSSLDGKVIIKGKDLRPASGYKFAEVPRGVYRGNKDVKALVDERSNQAIGILECACLNSSGSCKIFINPKRLSCVRSLPSPCSKCGWILYGLSH